MKNIISKTNLRLSITIILLLLLNSVFAQVSKYEKIEKVGKQSFNYANKKTNPLKLKKSKSILVVYSDRANNTSYIDPYGQLKKVSQNFMTPYFVIDSKNDAYEVVIADSTLLGKPKSLFSFLMNRKYHFTNAKGLKYIGWIPKNHVLNYNNSLISEVNNKPLKFKIGINNIEGLYELNKAFEGDSIRVFKDPFFKNTSTNKLALNQTVYPYKYNDTRKAVLISNKPMITDTIANVVGWVPANLITPIGQGYVYDLAKKNTKLTLEKCDTLQLHRNEIYSNYLYDVSLNKFSNSINSSTNIPFYVWNHIQNKLINVKGNNILISEANRLEQESKTINFHFVFEENKSFYIKPLINSLQNLGLFFNEHSDLDFNFSAICISDSHSYVLPKTKSFAKWLDFIQTIVEEGEEKKALIAEDCIDLSQAINASITTNEVEKNFENNFFIIAGSQDIYNLYGQDHLIKKMALKSSKLLFVQLQNRASESSQENLLLAKETLSRTASYYNKFIENYIIDNGLLINKSTLKNIKSENNNIYLYDAPNNSLFNGGIIFPSINQTIEPKVLSTAIDSVLLYTLKTNDKLISSLNKYERELGVLRSEPSNILHCIFNSDTLSIDSIDRSNPNDVYYKTEKLDQTITSSLEKGYEMNKEELLALIENYRVLVPRFTTSKMPTLKSKTLLYSSREIFYSSKESSKFVARSQLTKKNQRVLHKIYKKQIKGINKAFKRRVIHHSDKLSKLFFYKTGIKVHGDFNKFQSCKMKSKQTVESGFYEFYNEIINKVDVLEKKFLDNELQMIKKDIYYVPEKLLL